LHLAEDLGAPERLAVGSEGDDFAAWRADRDGESIAADAA
jgi:hypothetical protein